LRGKGGLQKRMGFWIDIATEQGEGTYSRRGEEGSPAVISSELRRKRGKEGKGEQ